jgi:hypothetical protein
MREIAEAALRGLKKPQVRKEAEVLLRLAVSEGDSRLLPVVGLDGFVGQAAIRQGRQGKAPSDEALCLAGYAARLGQGHLGILGAVKAAGEGRLLRSLSSSPLPAFLEDFIRSDL